MRNCSGLYFFLIVVSMIFAAGGCAGGGAGGGQGTPSSYTPGPGVPSGSGAGAVELRVSWPGATGQSKLIPQATERIEVTLSGEGLPQPLSQSVARSQVQGGQSVISFQQVPVGSKKVEVRALDAGGQVVAHRLAALTVEVGQTAQTATSLGVTVGDGAVEPQVFPLNKDEILLWVNNGQQSHHIKADGGAFDSGVLQPGATFSWRANTPGQLSYHCLIHPAEVGVLNVPDAFSPSDGILTAAIGNKQVTLNWSGFSDLGTGITGYRLVYKTTGFPVSPDDGTLVYSGPGTSFLHSGLAGGTTHYYKLFAVDGAGNVSSGAAVSAVPWQLIRLTATNHSMVLRSDGAVWTWGYNNYGQLGDGTLTNRRTPVQVSGLSGIIAVAGGAWHSVALKNDGTVWTWGRNNNGQLGDGTNTDRSTPVQVGGLNSVIFIAAGAFHTLAVRSDGTVWAWGWNIYGQLGFGGGNRTSPTQVPSLTGLRALCGGYGHTAALKNDGTVWAWGLNGSGQLGDGTTTNRISPVLTGISGVSDIAAGNSHTLAVKSDGTAWAWGFNTEGQLGDGTTVAKSSPVQVNGLTGVTKVSGGNHSMALKDDGTVRAWGANASGPGQLGDGTTTDRYTPVAVNGLTGVSAISAGTYHSMGLAGNDGSLWAWGRNGQGQLGDNTTTNRSSPVRVSGY